MINTKDLLFVEYNEKYAKQCHENCLSQEETAKYTLWKPTQNVDEAKAKLNFWTKDLNENDIFWIILEKKSNQAIGFICAGETSPNLYGDVGIAIGLDFVKQGYGSQALNKLIEYIKIKGGKEIHYSHFEENEASKVLALKFGFEFYKQDIRVRKHDNKTFNELFYVLNIN